MKIEVLTPGIQPDAVIRPFVYRKIRFVLERFEKRIDRAVIKLMDESQGSRKFDGSCQVDVWLLPTGRLHVKASGSNPEETVVNAVTKLEQAIAHNLEKNRSAARVRHEKSKREFIASLGPDTDETQPAEPS